MEKYIIRHPYLGKKLKGGFLEVEIVSSNLVYSEIGTTHNGLQCQSVNNYNEIQEKCKQVADLIREIDILNHIPTNKKRKVLIKI